MGNHVGVDKSATGRLFRCKINTPVSTFNIRSLNSIEMIEELTALAEEKGISVVCLQEHRKFHDNADVHYTDVGKGWILATVLVLEEVREQLRGRSGYATKPLCLLLPRGQYCGSE